MRCRRVAWGAIAARCTRRDGRQLEGAGERAAGAGGRASEGKHMQGELEKGEKEKGRDTARLGSPRGRRGEVWGGGSREEERNR